MKSAKKILSLFFAVVMAFSVCFIAAPKQEAQAASAFYSVRNTVQTYGTKKLFIGDKIGGIYFWSSYNSSTKKLTFYRASDLSSPKAVKTISCSDTSTSIYTGVVTNGSTVLFSMYNGSATYVYKTTVSGASPVLKATLAGHCWIVGFYGNQLYYGKGSSYDYSTDNELRRYTFGASKSYLVKSSFRAASAYGCYVAGITYLGSNSYKLKLLNVSTNKGYVISGPIRGFESVVVTSNRVIYAAVQFKQGASKYDGTYTKSVIRSTLNGSAKTTIWKKSYEYGGMGTYGWNLWVTRSCAYADDFSGSMMYFSDKLYQINYSTKKASLIINYST